jgi:hypothetical protein
MIQTKVAEEIKTHILVMVTFKKKNLPFVRSCGKMLYGQTGHRRPNKARAFWILDN